MSDDEYAIYKQKQRLWRHRQILCEHCGRIVDVPKQATVGRRPKYCADCLALYEDYWNGGSIRRKKVLLQKLNQVKQGVAINHGSVG